MKIYTNKFTDNFYLPLINTSSRDELPYRVIVDDTYNILSIENTVGPGPRNDIYITVPKVPSNPISSGTLYAKKRQSGEYYLEISSSNPIFRVYENGKRFYIFLSDGSYSNVYVDLMDYNGAFPNFLIEESSLKKLLPPGSSLPTVSDPVLLNGQYSISTEFQTRNFLKVSTNTTARGTQTASVILRALQTIIQDQVYEFIIDPVESPVKTVEHPPLGLREVQTSQLARSFVPMSSVVTLQLDSSGELYMDKIESGSSTTQNGYRRRCTNLGFEKDLSRFCSSIPKPALYSLSEEDIKSSTPNLSEQYFTDINAGVSINKETQEGFRIFAPLWIKDRVPSYFAIFRKPATHEGDNLLQEASLVKLIDIGASELGPYLNNLTSNENFSRPPLELSINNGYQVKWNGVSVDTGYWVSHTEFMGIEIQNGISDFEFNQMLSGGFSRGSIVNPQLLNVEFLFDDNEAELYDVYQYFGLYCDDFEMSRFIPNVDSTSVLFGQNETRTSSNKDFNSSVISNPDGVRLVVDLNDVPDRNLRVADPRTILVDSHVVSSNHKITILPTNQVSRRLRVSFTSDSDISSLFSNGKLVRLDDQNGEFVAYITVFGSSYDSITKQMQVNFIENDEYSTLGLSYSINIFDVSPDLSPSVFGRMRFDSPRIELSRCISISKKDLQGNEIINWLNSVLSADAAVRATMVFFDKSSSAYCIVVPNSTKEEQDYIKVFFSVMESNGQFFEGDEVFLNVSDYQISGILPGPKIVNSETRKFILKSKGEAHSVKSFELFNYKNAVVGLVSLDSTTYNLGSIIGTSSSESIPVRVQTSPYSGASITFSSANNDTISPGDSITVEKFVGGFKRRWSVIRSSSREIGVYRTSGAVTELEIVDGTLVSNDGYTQLEVHSQSYFPVKFDEFKLVNSESQQSDVELEFISAENQDNGNYLLTFSNKNVHTDYLTVRVNSPETMFTYFDYGPSDSLETVLAVAFQRFVDCPFRAIVGNGSLYLYSDIAESDISVGLYISSGTIAQMKINDSSLKSPSVIIDSTPVFSDYYVYDVDPVKNNEIYSIEPQFISRLTSDIKILSKSGAPANVLPWNNLSYGIPDIRSMVDGSEDRLLIKFEGKNQPSLLNDRLQLIDINTVSLSALSFYEMIDLDFFDEIPGRVGTYTVKDETAFAVVEDSGTEGKRITGVPDENIISNFSASIDSTEGKIRTGVGRWKRMNTSNVDLFPYLINVDPLLLPYDMFVNAKESGNSTTSFSLDWYLISGWPKFYPLADVSTNYQYTGKRINVDELKSTVYDYFTEYFTVGNGEEVFANGAHRQGKFLWSFIESGPNGYTTTFKGMPLTFSSSKTNIESTRFAAVLQVENDLEVPVRTSLIYNQRWNCMTLLVQINVDSYFVDGSISLEQLYQLQVNTAETNESTLYGPMLVYGENVLQFDRVSRAYNEREVVITNEPIETENYYEYNQYKYDTRINIKYNDSSSDIEIFGVKYYPNVDYIINGVVFSGTRYQTEINLVVPMSRIRGVFDPQLGSDRLFIDGIYNDDFFAVLSDVDGAPFSTYATFVTKNTIKIDGTFTVSNTYYPSSESLTFDGTTFISSARVYAIGDRPVYSDVIDEISAYSMLNRLSNSMFNDVFVSIDGTESTTNISMTYSSPNVIRPIKTKNASIDDFGNVTVLEKESNTNIFRLDGGFEPSYKRITSFAVCEEISVTRQLLNSLRGYNTKLMGVNQTNLWYRRVSEQGVNSGNIDVNGTVLNVPYAIGRRRISPLTNVWGEGFYSFAEDNFIDSPVQGIVDPKEQKFFLSSKVMSVPSFFRTSNYSVSEVIEGTDAKNSSVTYVSGNTRLSVQIDLEGIVSDYLFNSGVFAFFSDTWEELDTTIGPYQISKEYIDRNLLNRYSVESIDVYQRPYSRTEIVSGELSPEQQGLEFVNTIGIQSMRFFDFSIPIDGSKQVMLAFNIKRR
jgi:hypothetical protein